MSIWQEYNMSISRICKSKRGIYTLCPKIIKFEKIEKVCNEDIESLFMGLFRLLKVTIREEVEKEYVERIKRLEKELSLLRHGDMYQK